MKMKKYSWKNHKPVKKVEGAKKFFVQDLPVLCSVCTSPHFISNPALLPPQETLEMSSLQQNMQRKSRKRLKKIAF